MAIPESQLDTWSRQGAVFQSKDTYATVRRTLEKTQFANGAFSIFLQGSYGNDTNIFSESDVDTVIQLDASYYSDLSKLSPLHFAIANASAEKASYSYEDFKPSVIAALRSSFGNDVDLTGKKAVKIKPNGNRRPADVIIATTFRNYYNSPQGPQYVEGILFQTRDGRQVINYPKQHSENCTAKHQATKGWFKPTVRIFKNMRRRLVDAGIIDKSVAPSYFIEGMLYNVPNNYFVGSYADTVVSSLNWLLQTDIRELMCANEQSHLIQRYASCVDFWPSKNFHSFLSSIVEFWNKW